MPDFKIPYLPTFGHVGTTLRQLAPQIAVLYAHVAWEAIHNATSKANVKLILAGPTLRLAEKLAGEEANRARNKPQAAAKGAQAPLVWGSLGDIEFDLMSAPRRLDCTERMTYARHALIGAKSRIQYTGAELQELRLDLSWHALVVPDIEARMEALHKAMRERLILDLVIGDDVAGSTYAGDYVITGISHSVEEHLPDGSILSAGLNVDLLEWVASPDLVLAPTGPAVKTKKKAAPATAAQTKVDKDPDTGKILKGKG